MKITTKEVREVNKILDDIIKEYKEETPEKKRDWRTYEQQFYERLRVAFTELKPLVHEATQGITVVKDESRGAKPKLNLEQKVLILLLQRLFQKSNRNMSGMMVVFLWLTDVTVSYKTIERLYSDETVIMALHNLHMLILKRKGVENASCGGDGTGYALTVKKHYATAAQKLKNKLKSNGGKADKKSKKRQFIYSFALMDVETRMYIGFGMSLKSEQKAFHEAIELVKEIGINIKTIRLDKYFSAQKYSKFLGEQFKDVKLFLIPKSNCTVKGPWNWKKMLYDFVKDTKGYLKEYYKRNQSESGFAEDKKRTGWKLGQKRPDRINTTNTLIKLWHNMYWLAD